MSIVEPRTKPPRRRGWLARLLLGGGGGPGREPGPGSDGAAAPGKPYRSIQEAMRRLVAEGRYVFALLKAAEDHFDEVDTAPARAAVEEAMALVPGGVVPLVCADGSAELVDLPPFYLDRYSVTNRQFQRFVNGGCYDLLELWPQEIWPALMKFTDRTGRPGPAGWEYGRFPAARKDHPVVGICWYEAMAYAQWVGKRLPTAAEWQKAGGWPQQLSGGSCNRYPWGNIFDPALANLWATSLGDTAPVEAFPNGDTPNGIRQMTGNVWEWLNDPLETIPAAAGARFETWWPLRRIVGGASDTSLPSEATCHFVTGQPEFDRRPNIGFRCALSADQLRAAP
jgi:iron(II)-dependent oxidoreductase